MPSSRPSYHLVTLKHSSALTQTPPHTPHTPSSSPHPLLCDSDSDNSEGRIKSGSASGTKRQAAAFVSKMDGRVPKRQRKSKQQPVSKRARRTREGINQRELYADHESLSFGLFDTFSGRPSNWRYSLEVVQQPVRARMCGFGDKDRRPITPPPVVRLLVTDDRGVAIDPEIVDVNFFIVNASIWKVTDEEATLVVYPAPPKMHNSELTTENLVGNKVAGGYRVKGEDDQLGIFFMFHDLSIRTDGKFRLRFLLADLGIAIFAETVVRKEINKTDRPSDCLADVFSEPFEVFQAKKFPGMVEATALTRCFVTQGIRIPSRNTVVGKSKSKSKETDDSSKTVVDDDDCESEEEN